MTRWRYPILIVPVLLATALSGCGGQPALPTLTAQVTRVQPAAGAPVAEAVRGVTDLGHELAASAFPAGGNAVFSPLSIAAAFAMARAGAGGATAAQLDRVFGFPRDGRDDAFNAITRQVVTADVPPAKARGQRTAGPPQPPVVCLGNALFPQHGLPVGEPFLHTLAAQYGAGVHPVDFGDGRKATDLINQWVQHQTAGRITKVFDSLDASTRLVLANTVYLRADWDRNLFAEDPVTGAPFTRADGSHVNVPTMHASEELRYASADGWQAVELPYAGGQLAMRVLLPPPGQAPATMLAPQAMATVAAGLHQQDLVLSLPRWDFATELDLGAALQRIGLTAPFGPDADFGGISAGLYIQQAVHRANITVDEWGTEAAAVTGLAFGSAGRVAPPLRVDVDRPFAFAIVHTATGAPLFMGQVSDPSVR